MASALGMDDAQWGGTVPRELSEAGIGEMSQWRLQRIDKTERVDFGLVWNPVQF